jgi:Flp pilus assembly protein TadD
VVKQWFGTTPATLHQREVAATLDGGRRGDDRDIAGLVALLESGADVVRRASAARLLANWATHEDVQGALERAATRDSEALVRAAAVEALGELEQPPPSIEQVWRHAAADPVRLVRSEAGFALRRVSVSSVGPEDDIARRAFAEWDYAQTLNADLPEANYNRGVFLAAQGSLAPSEAAYRTALVRWPAYAPAREALAALLTNEGRVEEAEAELRELVARSPEEGRPHCLLGLHLGRYGRWPDAATELEACVARVPDAPRARYNLGLLYAKMGDLDRAATSLEVATSDPASRAEALQALVRLSSVRNDSKAVEKWLADALRADPTMLNDPSVMEALKGGTTQ